MGGNNGNAEIGGFQLIVALTLNLAVIFMEIIGKRKLLNLTRVEKGKAMWNAAAMVHRLFLKE
jgi:hypothetical protein